MPEVGSSDSNYNYYAKALDDLQESYRQNAKRQEDAKNEELERVREAAKRQNDQNEAQISERMENVRNEAYQRHVQSRAERMAEIDELKKQSYDRSGRFTAADGEALQQKINSLESALKETENNQARKDVVDDSRAGEREREMLRRLEKNTESLRASHEHENRVLRDQMRMASDVDRDITHEKAVARTDAYHEVENNLRTENKVVIDAYEDQLQSAVIRGKEQDRYYAQLNDKNLKDRERYFTQLLSGIGKNYNADRKDLEYQFQKGSAQEKKQHQESLAHTEKAYSKAIEKSDARREAELQQQAKAFQTTGAIQRQRTDDELRYVQAELQRVRTNPRADAVSPVAEENLRNQIYAQVEAQKQSENSSKEYALDQMKEGYARRMQELVADKKDETNKTVHSLTKERDMDRQTYLMSLYKVERDKQDSARDREVQASRETLSASRNRAQELRQVERELTGNLDRVREDGELKVADLRDDFEMKSLLKQREANERHNEMVRSYERRLSDQKFEFEQKIQDTLAEMKNRLQDADRQAKRSTEEITKGYDRRIAQMEQSSKERERIVAQNYENELEKVKRANALLIQKKS